MANMNREQVSRVAAFLKANPPKGAGMNFYSVQTPKGELVLDTMYPPVGHPRAIDFFFFACLHQYGFWYGNGHGYVEPMVGNIGEKKLKGSDLLWALLKRKLDADPSFFSPERLAHVTPRELGDVFTDDSATPWPDFEQRLILTQRYGEWLIQSRRTPRSIVEESNSDYQGQPLYVFRCIMRESGSPFALDYTLQKKQLLLAMVLANRPENFLKVSSNDQWLPIVDYHLMRVCLRLGLVDLDERYGEHAHNVARRWVLAWSEEDHIRNVVRGAVEQLIAESGLPMAAIDEALWMARKYCPEMTVPECDKCMFDSVCAKRTEMFQPVFRTTAY